MNKLLSFLFVLIASSADAQYLSWAKGLFGDPFPGVTSIATDASGNVYITGSYSSPMDVDPGIGVVNLAAPLGGDTYILKLDAAGNFLWVKELRSASAGDNVASTDIVVDATGNIYVTGRFDGTVDFDPGTNTSILSGVNIDGFLLKLDNSGNFVYSYPMGGSGSDFANSVCVDAQGYVMVTGTFESTADFDPTNNSVNLVSLGQSDVFVARYSNQGVFAWAKSRGSSGSEGSSTIITDAAGGTFATSSSMDTITIFRLDATGAFTWTKQIWATSSGMNGISRLSLDPNGGDIYATGTFSGTMDFDPSAGNFPLTATSNDMYVLKLYNSGNFAWAKMIDVSGIVTNATVAVFDQNNVYISGSYSGVADLNPGTATYNVTALSSAPDIFIAKLNTLGNFISGGSVGGKIDDAVADMATSSTGDVFLTGIFRDTADFDPGAGTSTLISPGGGYSTYVLKLSATVGVAELYAGANDVQIYPNPATGGMAVETGNNKYDRYTIYGSIGQQICSGAMSSNKVNIDVSRLPAGMYHIMLECDGRIARSKFTKL